MSGQLLVGDPDAPVSATSGSGSPSPTRGPDLRFTDQRTFGHLALAPGGAVLPAADRAHRARPDGARLSTRPRSSAGCAARRTGIKRALLDQSLVSGIGNIYADEALWRARLHWARPPATLSRAEVGRLLAAVPARSSATRCRPAAPRSTACT